MSDRFWPLMGLLAYPAMANAGYQKSFAAGVICAGGTLGILIPPSIMLIVYAAIAELSPLRLYAAAVFPGLLLAFLLGWALDVASGVFPGTYPLLALLVFSCARLRSSISRFKSLFAESSLAVRSFTRFSSSL